MSKLPEIVVLCGGQSREREISLVSGRSFANTARDWFPVRLMELERNELPANLDPESVVVAPILHGTFGEDGELQGILEQRGLQFLGSDSSSSRLCMDKPGCKAVAASRGVPVLDQILFEASAKPDPKSVVDQLGKDCVVKPTSEGSSVGLHICDGIEDLRKALSTVDHGRWMIEPRVFGYDLSVGVLNGKAMGLVSIQPSSGVYDYKSKYEAADTVYQCPAKLSGEMTAQIQRWAVEVFSAVGCRDFARIDFYISNTEELYFLESNTIPGMTATSLFPKSAAAYGYSFSQLIQSMIAPAVHRWQISQTPVLS
jgi:D-alanine-D-alanine ligase